MNVLLLSALVKGAVEIFTNKQAAKENLTSKTTVAAILPAIAGVAAYQTEHDMWLAVAGCVISVLMFLYRKGE